MLTLMQDMLLSLCLLSAAFTVETVKHGSSQEGRRKSVAILHHWNYESSLTKDLVKNLVKPRYKRHVTAVQSSLLIIHPHLLKKVE